MAMRRVATSCSARHAARPGRTAYTSSAVLLYSSNNADRMPDPTDPRDKTEGFKRYTREDAPYRDATERAADWNEILDEPSDLHVQTQAARCMDCGTPFCQSATGCPIGNVIPKWNDLVYQQQWKQAWEQLSLTNNFPEFTGRVCPAPCEGACVLGINEPAVAIKSIEAAIADRGFEMGLAKPAVPRVRTGKKVAIVGSGPAGLAAADQLNRAGHTVTVYERADRVGGLLMYGIPNMKLDKGIVQRRVDLLSAGGISFVCNTEIGVDISAEEVLEEHDAVLLASGATQPRDLPIEGRELNNVHFAMDYLTPNTQTILGPDGPLAHASPWPTAAGWKEGSKMPSCPDVAGKNVIVVGGGDTGVDCIGTALRQGAESVISFEILPQPPEMRAEDNPWPTWPRIFRVDYGHSESMVLKGRDPREYSISSKRFVDDGAGNVKGIDTVRVEWVKDEQGRFSPEEVEGSEEFLKADYVFLAMGFTGQEAESHSLHNAFGMELTKAGNLQAARGKFYQSQAEKVWIAGDCRRGQSLVVWAIDEGRQAARDIDKTLMGISHLPVTGGVKKLVYTASLNASKNVAGLDPAHNVQRHGM